MIDRICVGLTGRMASGKGEVAKIFMQHGYRYISLSDIVREEARKRGKHPNRNEMQDIGDQLRTGRGAGVLGIITKKKIENTKQKKWVIDGIRNPAEIIELKKIHRFYLIGINADMSIILDRVKKRDRQMDKTNQTLLSKALNREWGSEEISDGQQVGECIKMADFLIENNDSLEHLNSRVEELLKKLEQAHE
jgi:dephospho-CoA kinase